MERENKCLHCGATKTPQWRAGPLGPKTLCNACGVRYRSGRLCPEYRPAKCPTFSRELHSNSHKEVSQIRSKKQMMGMFGLDQDDMGRFREMSSKKAHDAVTTATKKETMSQDADTTIKKEASMEGDLHPLYNEGADTTINKEASMEGDLYPLHNKMFGNQGMKAPEVGPSKHKMRREVYKPDVAPSKSKDDGTKIPWDAVTTNIYCQVCAEEVNAGNEPSKIGWRNVAAKFNARVNGNYDKKQLICKWYELKNDWLLWKQLVGQETDLNWDHKSGKINAGPQWWDEKIQANPEVAKFCEGGLPNISEMNIMFSEVVPAGEKRCLRPRGLMIPSKQDVRSEGVIKLEIGGLSEIKVNLVSSKSQSARINKKRKTKLDGQKSHKIQVQKGKGKHAKVGIDTPECCGAAVDVERKLDHMSAAVEGRHSRSSLRKTSRKTDTPGCSILKCMALLRSLPGLEQGGELFTLGTRLFIKQDYREMFVSLQRADMQLAWLKQELERERASGKKQ